ncbi:hypothetical protein BVRB_6g144140 [Beta vulgaris subsp. vulgaris]|uniref:Integrase catalytic domain-containing protein n=1 Tax=Beta vulgaris subsp. vulgaris TaxID=3555 RepID=A0A0J8C2S7_BETVV|nr:hypothetical protein BVRB_6g144140 [Beta vulgaris subsp. vulgaris]
MTDCYSSNIAGNRSFRIQVEDTVDDERPPRGQGRHHAAVHLEGRSATPVIQENLDRPVTAGHLETVLNDFHTRMATVMEEKIKNNMLFFHISLVREAAEPLKGKSQEEPVESPVEICLNSERPERTLKIGSVLGSETKDALVALLREFEDVFAYTVEEMQGIDPEVVVHKLNIESGHKPVRQKKRHLGPARNQAVDQEVQKLLKSKFIRETFYPDWIANVVMVTKPNGTWRMCVDYTDLNMAYPKDSFLLPKIDRLVDSTAGNALLSFMDAYSVFHQIRMWPEDQDKTSFITEKGLYGWLRMAFDLRNAPVTFQRLINTVFQPQLGRNMEAYIDVMIVKSQEEMHHLEDLRETFTTLRKYKLKLNPHKCVFGVVAGKFLGFLVNQRGIEANPDADGRYSSIEKFGLALLMASWKLRPYFLAHSILVYTDQPLRQVLHKMDASGRMLKWVVVLNMFDLSFEPRKAIKGKALADFIVELTRPTIEPVQDPAEGKRHWTLMVDESSTTNGCGAGIIFQSPEGDKFEYAMKFQFQASNNEAEYEALLAGIKMCKAAGALEIEAKTDSLLVVSQVNGDFECKEASMRKYMNLIKEEVKSLKRFVLDQVPRSENHQADALSKLASSAEGDGPRTVFWEVKAAKSIDSKEVLFLSCEGDWMSPIIDYTNSGRLPLDPLDAKYVKTKDKWIELWNGSLYKRSFNRPLLKCISRKDVIEVLKELHEGAYTSHIGGRALREKALRTVYFWPTLKEDALLYAKKLAGQKKFVIVAVDYFTKWVEAEAMRGITTNDVKGFVWKNLSTRFGMPQSIVFDNGPQFETPKLRQWLADQGIKAHFAAVAHPLANGQVESFNKTPSAGIKKKLDNARGLWFEELQLVLWSIRTTTKNSTGETPFMLVYGSEVVLPI